MVDLDISFSPIVSEALSSVIPHFQLKKLSFSDFTIKYEHERYFNKFFIQHCQYLRELHLSVDGNDELLIEVIGRCPHLYKLKVKSEILIDSNQKFYELFKPNNCLKHLAIFRSEFMQPNICRSHLTSLQKFLEKFPFIESLSFKNIGIQAAIFTEEDIQQVARRLPNLRHLSVHSLNNALIAHGSFNYLTNLEIESIDSIPDSWAQISVKNPNIQCVTIKILQTVTRNTIVFIKSLSNLSELVIGAKFNATKAEITAIRYMTPKLKSLTLLENHWSINETPQAVKIELGMENVQFKFATAKEMLVGGKIIEFHDFEREHARDVYMMDEYDHPFSGFLSMHYERSSDTSSSTDSDDGLMPLYW